MCTPILTRSVRWRVRDFASCFLACRFSVEEDPNRSSSPKQKHPMGDVVLENTGGDTKKINKNRCDADRRRKQSPRMSKNIVSIDDESQQRSSRPCFNDEEYIVACINEDGGFEVIEDAEGRSIEGEINAAAPPPKHNCDGERSSSICREVELPSGSLGRGHPVVDETVSVESNESDGSTGSFAFPVLGGGEWMGTPVRMPKLEGTNTRKNKTVVSVGFQCFRMNKT